MENKIGVHETSRGPYIQTFTGKRFYPLDIRPRDIDIVDIAHALSLQCRFAGHVRWHYSVGQHSVLVSHEMARMDSSPSYTKYLEHWEMMGLLHDASEAYLVDIPRPIKLITDFSVYRDIEKRVQRVIYEKYIGRWNEPEQLNVADNLLLAKEAFSLMDNPRWCHDMPKSAQRITRMEPQKVEKAFLKRFYELL